MTEYHYPAFRRWVGRQAGKYQFRDNSSCPMALWGKSIGMHTPFAGQSTVDDWEFDGPGRTLVRLEHGALLMGAINAFPMTYEALAKRLDATFTKTGLRRQRPGKRLPYKPTGPLGSFKRGVVS